MHHYRATCAWRGSTGAGYEEYGRARLDVIRYEDDAESFMPEDDPPLRITRIVLRPHITVRAGDRHAGRADALITRVRHCCEVAHRECYIANSLTTEIVIEPTVEVVDG